TQAWQRRPHLFGWRRWLSVADNCGIADDRFEPFIDVPTNFSERPLWVDGVEKPVAGNSE
ncbi:MAG: hypothetical protein ACREU6_17070, partial [Steroidobacteraceae bacterium]